jgi:YidC/Oxa1 family membrane protein insertase
MQQLDQRNLIIAIVISIAIVLGFEFFYNLPRVEREKAARQQEAAQTQAQAPAAPGAPAQAPSAPGAVPPSAPGVPTAPTAPAASVAAAAAAQQPRVKIEAPHVSGSIRLAGARVDDLKLTSYRQTVDPGSPPITLLAPQGTAEPYFAEFGWVAATPGAVVPSSETMWTADRDTLTADRPVTFTWDNGQGLRFERRYAIDRNYMFQVTQRVVNTGGTPVDLHPFGLVSRHGTPHTAGFYILHEGPIGVFNSTLAEYSYGDLKDKKAIEKKTTTGWIGITDKYWLVALIPDQGKEKTARFTHTSVANADRYQVDYLDPAMSVPAGGSVEITNRMFAGAKEVRLLDQYAADLKIDRFDLAVDWGWFRFLTKPIFIALDYFYRLLGNFGLAILLLTVIIKGLFFPLANKSYKAMSKMKLLQPEMEKLREKYGEDRQRMSQELMDLYKKHGANPMAGCLPIVIQIPVFFALYKVLFITIEMRHAPFYGWIKDLSHYDPTSVFNLVGLLPWSPPELYLLGGTIGAWPLIMGATMFLQQKLNPQPPDPVQAKIFMLMPIFFTFLLATFPAGLVIYWAWNNVLSVTQQWVIMKRMGAAPGAPAPAKAAVKK